MDFRPTSDNNRLLRKWLPLEGCMGPLRVLLCTIVLLVGCATSRAQPLQGDFGGGGGLGRNSAEARITHLISEGQFAEAEALIVESSEAGLLEKSTAVSLRKAIAEQSTKL